MFRMYGNQVEVLRYQVDYTENEEQFTVYAATEEEADEIAQRYNGVKTLLASSDDEWMDGLEVADVPDTYAEAVRVYQSGKSAYLNSLHIPSAESSAVIMMKAFLKTQRVDDDDERIKVSGLYDDWTAGSHSVGDVYNANGQSWECFQPYDNSIYPDINPENPAWYTFNRPLHGKSLETARPFVPVQGAHDMYHAGEYMIFTDGVLYKCLSDTNFSPEEYPQAWEKQRG